MPARHSASFFLVLIDARPLQHAAWSEFHAARKLAEKAARDLHRHEETDTLAYERWLHGTFPQLVTTLRELHAEVTRKARDMHHAQFMANVTGRSVKKVWKENREDEADPAADERDHEPESEHESSSHSDYTRADDDGDDDEFASRPSAPTPDSPAARDIYRRLVQHLHPDRGGEWTPARENLWHQVQQAWAARDADWLSRLEIEWDTANDQIGPDSSLSRLRRAIAELHAARRDTERKLRNYRHSPAWRFTLSEKKRPQLQRRLNSELQEDLVALQRHLAYLNDTIAAWESPTPSERRHRAK
ncbi:hypothetical protein [Rariglobus hedericola]|uniref:Uncharacterized protein n=1 Tax=Rariglobus hedericola TaxID=2597822 RepID=A0A556QSM9_9BACT|nr:hypothetical protein [Rariglobus hedericola]TSJ79640.1 hypothetical protein FPL22_10245 [Rariglobus hedericola]